MSETFQKTSPDPFAQCPSGCVCGVRELVARAHKDGPRNANDVDAAEMRALLTAVRSGYEDIRSDPRIVERRHAANSAYARVKRQLAKLQTMLDEQQISRAAADVTKATDVAATDGRHRATWLRWLRWPVVIGIGLFDVWYFSQVFRYLTSQTGDAAGDGPGVLIRSWETLVAFVPGMVLAVVIAASATLLLRPLEAWRAAAFKAPARSDVESHVSRTVRALRAAGRWTLRLAWWLLPVSFVLTLLLVLGVWAGLRAKYPSPPSEGYPLASVMLLIVMLAVGTMAVKLLAEDRTADELSAARRRLWRLRRTYLWRARRADRLIGNYDSTWSDLKTLRDDLAGLLRIKMLSAWESFILRIRSLHQVTGNVTAAGSASANDHRLIRPEFAGIPQPEMELGPMLEICRLVEERNPDRLRERKRNLDERFACQVDRNLPPVKTREPAGTDMIAVEFNQPAEGTVSDADVKPG